jgi:hypothetical protein
MMLMVQVIWPMLMIRRRQLVTVAVAWERKRIAKRVVGSWKPTWGIQMMRMIAAVRVEVERMIKVAVGYY